MNNNELTAIAEKLSAFPHVIIGDCLLVNADSLDVLPLLPQTLTAVVTDPPAGIAFMGKDWDDFGRQKESVEGKSTGMLNAVPGRGGHPKDVAKYRKRARENFIEWMTKIASETLNAILPGGHALVWALPRTSHWTATAWEDGGWEPRDVIHHIHGQGFPKSMNVSKALDKEAGAEREIVGVKMGAGMSIAASDGAACFRDDAWKPESRNIPVTAPATEEAKTWKNYGSALKPAVEHWWLCRKPIEGTIAANAIKYGTGTLNIDGCRIGTGGDKVEGGCKGTTALHDGGITDRTGVDQTQGRWPANLTHDGSPEVLAEFPDTISNSTGKGKDRGIGYGGTNSVSFLEPRPTDSGSAARFFYCAKASRADRNGGLEDLKEKISTDRLPSLGRRKCKTCGAWEKRDSQPEARMRKCECALPEWENIQSKANHANIHPTVKPNALMKWLLTLVKMPGRNLILDPFMGSGSTLVAAAQLGIPCIGIEREPEYFEIAKRRVAHAADIELPDEEEMQLKQEKEVTIKQQDEVKPTQGVFDIG